MRQRFSNGDYPRDYEDARKRFLAACSVNDIVTDRIVHPLAGPNGETLSTDVAWLGSATARHLVIVISGTHGPEGLMGSACQTRIASALAAKGLVDAAVLLVHLINPWGTAWRRRQTENNVDLNRNFRQFENSLPENPNYDALRAAIHEPDYALAGEAIDAFRAERGARAFASALFQGQYVDAAGIGYGGDQPTWSNRTLRAILDEYARHSESVVIIDLHSGIGPYGHATLLHMGAMPEARAARLRSLLGPGVIMFDDDSPHMPYPLSGDLCRGAAQQLKARSVIPLLAEFGTYEEEVLLALQVEDCRLQEFGGVAEDVRRRLQDFFYPDDDDWKDLVCLRSLQIVRRMLYMRQRELGVDVG
nr:DUF2817 domain-containing protein [Sphingomonas sp. Y57]